MGKIKGNNLVRVFYDMKGNTLNVWFDNPEKEYVSEEVGDEVIVNKDKRGHVIGFEKLNFKLFSGRNKKVSFPRSLPVEVVVN